MQTGERMSLPRAVLEAEQRAEELLKQLNGAVKQESSQDEIQTADTSLEQEQPTEVVPAEQQLEAFPSEPQKEEDIWEQRYKSLRGKYDAEVPRMAASNKELTSRLQSIERELEKVKTFKAVTKDPLIKPEEIQEYGEPLVDLIRRAAREEVSAKDAEIESLKSTLERFEASTTKNAEIDFYERLRTAVPDWEELNRDKDFLQWLSEYDELSGNQRQDSLDEAVRNNDALRASRFFNKWKDISTKQAATVSRNLESQIVPSSTRVSSTPAGKKIWNRSEIADFYMKARKGSITDKDMVAIEADIHAAQLENRIR